MPSTRMQGRKTRSGQKALKAEARKLNKPTKKAQSGVGKGTGTAVEDVDGGGNGGMKKRGRPKYVVPPSFFITFLILLNRKTSVQQARDDADADRAGPPTKLSK
jgi:hypothetical protein